MTTTTTLRNRSLLILQTIVFTGGFGAVSMMVGLLSTPTDMIMAGIHPGLSSVTRLHPTLLAFALFLSTVIVITEPDKRDWDWRASTQCTWQALLVGSWIGSALGITALAFLKPEEFPIILVPLTLLFYGLPWLWRAIHAYPRPHTKDRT